MAAKKRTQYKMLQLATHFQTLPSISTSKPLPPLPVIKSILTLSPRPPQHPQLKIYSVQPDERCHLSDQEAESPFYQLNLLWPCDWFWPKEPCGCSFHSSYPAVWLWDLRVIKPSLTSKRRVCWREGPSLQPASTAGHVLRPSEATKPRWYVSSCSLQWVPGENHRAKPAPASGPQNHD